MLVSRNRFILKTCGTTTLLHAIKPLMSLVQEIYPGATVMVRGGGGVGGGVLERRRGGRKKGKGT